MATGFRGDFIEQSGMFRIEHGLTGDVTTVGLVSDIGFDLRCEAIAPALRSGAEALLRYLAEYFASAKVTLKSGETIDWASSLLIASGLSPTLIGLNELDFDGVTVRVGVSNTIEIWKEQSALCQLKSSDFVPCRFGDKIAVSPNALESTGPLEGIRYQPAEGISGGGCLRLTTMEKSMTLRR